MTRKTLNGKVAGNSCQQCMSCQGMAVNAANASHVYAGLCVFSQYLATQTKQDGAQHPTAAGCPATLITHSLNQDLFCGRGPCCAEDA